MLDILLSNAVKFTPVGGELGLLVSADPGQGVIQFTVWDNGIGIAASDMARLFKPFSQVDGRLARQYNGAGLGLVLVQRLAELHGGCVSLVSAPGEGSRFTVSLPWLPEGETAESVAAVVGSRLAAGLAQELALPAESPVRQKTILLADGHEDDAAFLSNFLGMCGCQVITAHNGIETLDRVLHSRPDLILMGMQMPGMDGLQTIKSIRRLPVQYRGRVPIIALTTLDLPGDRERCLQEGANQYLCKPLNLKLLLEEIEKYL
jgi:CheY-like chemotaxis protein